MISRKRVSWAVLGLFVCGLAFAVLFPVLATPKLGHKPTPAEQLLEHMRQRHLFEAYVLPVYDAMGEGGQSGSAIDG
jgi:hypothetical protein